MIMKFVKKIKNRLSFLWKAVSQVDRSKGSRFSILCDMIYCKLRYHAKVEEYLAYRLYDYRHCYRKNFLFKYHQQRLYRKVNEILNTKFKYSFYQLIPDMFQREIILAPACGEDAFLDFLRRHQRMVIKPNKGSCGIDVCLIEYENDQQALDFFRKLKIDVICEEYIRQHPVMMALNPSTVNTIRVVSLRHSETDVEILSATLRCGARNDTIIDNLNKGGVGAAVDVETGIVSTFGKDYKLRTYSHHPLTGVQIIGLQIPNWEKAMDLLKRAHARLPENRILGWDIAITETGADIVEANSAPAPRSIQMIDGKPKGEKILKILKNKKNHIYHH